MFRIIAINQSNQIITKLVSLKMLFKKNTREHQLNHFQSIYSFLDTYPTFSRKVTIQT